MKLVFFAVFALLVRSICSIEVGQNRDNRTKLVNLHDDILYVMFQGMPIDSLLKMAQMNSRFRYIAKDVARRKYRLYQLEIIADSKKAFDEGEQLKLTIHDIPMAFNVLEYFGNSFRILKISNAGIELDDFANLSRFANKYCSKTLKTLSLDIQPSFEFNDYEYDEQLTEYFEIPNNEHQQRFNLDFSLSVLDYFTIPFEALEKLHIRQHSFNETMKLNQMFPQLKRFHFHVMIGADYSFFNCELPQLEYVDISVAMEYNENIKENVEGLIRKNPTIRSINLLFHASKDPNWLKFVSQHLPHLENLTLSTFENRY